MKFSKCIVLLLVLACIAMFAAGCTSSKTAATPPASVATAAPAHAVVTTGASAAAAPVPTTIPCPDKEVLTGSWDSREVGYASNHDVREEGIWTDASPVPVILSQKCWDATGTFHTGDCNGKLTGKMEKNVFSGTWTNECTTSVDNSKGTFSVTMAADNQSFIGSMFKTCEGCYGPENGFPPSWWAKKTV